MERLRGRYHPQNCSTSDLHVARLGAVVSSGLAEVKGEKREGGVRSKGGGSRLEDLQQLDPPALFLQDVAELVS